MEGRINQQLGKKRFQDSNTTLDRFRDRFEILVKWTNHFWVRVFIWSLQIIHDHRPNRIQAIGSFAIVQGNPEDPDNHMETRLDAG